MKELSFLCNTNVKMKNTTHTVETVLKSNRKIVEREKIDTPSSLGTDTSLKSGGVKLGLWTQASPLMESLSL